MQVGVINAYRFNPASQQQVGFTGGTVKRIATAEELLAEATKCNVIIDKIDRVTRLPKGIGAILVELSAKLSPAPNRNPLGVLQNNEAGRKQLFGQLQQMLFERAAQLGINIQGKSSTKLGAEVLETEQLLSRFKKYGISPRSQDIAGLKGEAAAIEATYKDAESRGIRTDGKDLPTVLRELAGAPKTPRPAAANPQGTSGAGKVFAQVGFVPKAKSINQILESSPKTREDAVMVLKALGHVFKVQDAEGLSLNATDAEIKIIYRKLVHNAHTDINPDNAKYIKSLNEAKTFLLPK